MENKQQLLDSPMNKLGLGGAFNSHFYSKDMQQSEVITLTEFISLNQCIKANKDKFVCWRNSEVEEILYYRQFIKESISFKKLKSFLLENNFTHKDWMLLLPNVKTPKGLVPDLTFLDKKSLLNLPYHQVTETKLECRPAERIRYFFEHQGDELILVKEILSLTNIQVNSLGSSKSFMEKTFVNMQKKFKKYGLTEEDGPFMKIRFSWSQSKDDYVNDLIFNKDFSKEEAIIAVNFGVRAGWIVV